MINLSKSANNPDPEFWKRRRVLLTGHTGFKGSWLALWLLEMGAEVTGIALEPSERPNLFEQLQLSKRINHYSIDIRNPNLVWEALAMSSPEVVIHLAAQPLVRRSYIEPVLTWETNVMGTINILEAIRQLSEPCTAVMITTDKVYRNNEWLFGYRENDVLGGQDPYSSSKAAAEHAIHCWRASYCGNASDQNPHLRIASARAGNVIGGGDWAQNRIVPDVVRALSNGEPIHVRNPHSTRPWQHVLEPLSGYILLAECMHKSAAKNLMTEASALESSFNFGPALEANRSVQHLVEEALLHWQGSWSQSNENASSHESTLLSLNIDKAHHLLGWSPRWSFSKTVERTIRWYRNVHEQQNSAVACCLSDLEDYLHNKERV